MVAARREPLCEADRNSCRDGIDRRMDPRCMVQDFVARCKRATVTINSGAFRLRIGSLCLLLCYLSDFAVYLKSLHFVIAEVKPLADMLDHRVQAKAEGIMDFCCRRGFGFLLTDGRHTPDQLLKGTVNRRLERELTTAIAAIPIREEQYKAIKERCDALPGQLYRAIIRLDLKYASRRFKLQSGDRNPVFRQVYFRKKRYDESVEERIASLLGSGPHGL